MRDAALATLTSMSEAELAECIRDPGTIIEHRGRYWRQGYRGLYEPVHPMARLSAEEATRPAQLCWAYSATLDDAASPRANATRPMHLLADLASFGPHALSSNRRYHLRRSRRSVEFVQVTDVAALEPGGYEVFCSSQQRTMNPWRSVSSREAFLDEMRWFTDRPSAIVLAGLVDGRIGGWIAGFAVAETAYIEVVDLATEALSSHISIGLHFEFIEACRRSTVIREIVHSPHIPEDPALCVFKAAIGFPVARVPSRFAMAPGAESLVRWRKPFFYYRLTGRATGKVIPALGAAAGRTAAG